MAHYAYLDENNVVVDVITGIDETSLESLPEGFDSWESYYGDLRNQRCLRFSYNTFGNVHFGQDGNPDSEPAFRFNCAAVGGSYSDDLDAFIFPQPYPSWTLDESTCQWKAPVPHPDDELLYAWDEETTSWVQIDLGD